MMVWRSTDMAPGTAQQNGIPTGIAGDFKSAGSDGDTSDRELGNREQNVARFAALRRTIDSNAQKEVELRSRMETALAQFVYTELDLALTFCDMALSTRDSDHAKRRVALAMEAYESAGRYLQELEVAPYVKQQINEKLRQLQKALEQVKKGTGSR